MEYLVENKEIDQNTFAAYNKKLDEMLTGQMCSMCPAFTVSLI